MTLPSTDTLQINQDGPVLHITLNRPDSRNAMSLTMVNELMAVFAAVENDADVRAIVLRGAGGHFCAGGDIKDMAGARQQAASGDSDAFEKLNRRFGEMITAANHQPQVLITVLEGAVLGGGFGHFYAYAPEKYQYPIDRYTMEVKRQLDVLDRHLADNRFMAGDEYTIADIAIHPWYGALVKNRVYEAAEFLEAHTYTNVLRWTEEIDARPAVQRGRMVNRTWGEPNEQLHERHDASDFTEKTEDKR